MLYPVRGLLESTTPEFRRKLCDVATWIGCDATDLAAVMAFESGFDPRARNKSSGATGLMQWMPSTASGYGLTVDQIAQMSAVQQLELVKRYFAGWRGRVSDCHALYMVVWNGSPAPLDKTLGVRDEGGHSGAVYRMNSTLDRNGDGKITAAEASSIVRAIAAAARKLPPVTDCAPTAEVEAPKSTPKATATATVSGSPSASLSSRCYRVATGDTAWGLAERYTGSGKRWAELLTLNPRARIERLTAGDAIQLPAGWL